METTFGACPECGEPLEADGVDIGVGIQYGPSYCPCCGWTPKSNRKHNDEEITELLKERKDERNGE